MNKYGGSTPYKLGLVELGLYDLPNAGRLIIPKTLLRTREASRHVVTISLQGVGREAVSATVSTPSQPTEKRKLAPAASPLTEQKLVEQIRAKNSPETAQIGEAVVSKFMGSGLKSRGMPSTVQFGPDVGGSFMLGNPVEGERDSGLKLNAIPL
jgi:hypothetical protein